ncbi:hypothetical protein [Streptomyces laurentii]
MSTPRTATRPADATSAYVTSAAARSAHVTSAAGQGAGGER